MCEVAFSNQVGTTSVDAVDILQGNSNASGEKDGGPAGVDATGNRGKVYAKTLDQLPEPTPF